MQKALGFIPTLHELITVLPDLCSQEQAGQKTQGPSQLHRKLEANLEWVRSHLKKKKKKGRLGDMSNKSVKAREKPPTQSCRIPGSPHSTALFPRPQLNCCLPSSPEGHFSDHFPVEPMEVNSLSGRMLTAQQSAAPPFSAETGSSLSLDCLLKTWRRSEVTGRKS